VTFNSAEEADAAINGQLVSPARIATLNLPPSVGLNDQDLDGRRLKVNLANARGGGGGGGGQFWDRDFVHT
jgi:hypothetical protein